MKPAVEMRAEAMKCRFGMGEMEYASRQIQAAAELGLCGCRFEALSGVVSGELKALGYRVLVGPTGDWGVTW